MIPFFGQPCQPVPYTTWVRHSQKPVFVTQLARRKRQVNGFIHSDELWCYYCTTIASMPYITDCCWLCSYMHAWVIKRSVLLLLEIHYCVLQFLYACTNSVVVTLIHTYLRILYACVLIFTSFCRGEITTCKSWEATICLPDELS